MRAKCCCFRFTVTATATVGPPPHLSCGGTLVILVGEFLLGLIPQPLLEVRRYGIWLVSRNGLRSNRYADIVERRWLSEVIDGAD